MRKDAARNRGLLIDAAREVFAQRGLEASLDDVAHRAGLGVGTAYRHFANKYELAGAILQHAVDEIVAHAEHALTVEDPWQALVGVNLWALTVTIIVENFTGAIGTVINLAARLRGLRFCAAE